MYVARNLGKDGVECSIHFGGTTENPIKPRYFVDLLVDRAAHNFRRFP